MKNILMFAVSADLLIISLFRGIRYESEAVIAIINRRSVDWTLIWNYAIIYGVSKIIDGQKYQYLGNLRDCADICIMVDGAIKKRAELFMECGIKALDA